VTERGRRYVCTRSAPGSPSTATHKSDADAYPLEAFSGHPGSWPHVRGRCTRRGGVRGRPPTGKQTPQASCSAPLCVPDPCQRRGTSPLVSAVHTHPCPPFCAPNLSRKPLWRPPQPRRAGPPLPPSTAPPAPACERRRATRRQLTRSPSQPCAKVTPSRRRRARESERMAEHSSVCVALLLEKGVRVSAPVGCVTQQQHNECAQRAQRHP